MKKEIPSNNWKGRNYDTAVLASPVRVGDEEFVMFAVVEKKDRNLYYLHELLPVKKQSDGSFQVPSIGQKPTSSEPSDMDRIVRKYFEGKEKKDQGGEPSFSVITNAESRIAESFNPFLRNPEQRRKIVLEAQKRSAEKGRVFQEIIRFNRTGADIDEFKGQMNLRDRQSVRFRLPKPPSHRIII